MFANRSASPCATRSQAFDRTYQASLAATLENRVSCLVAEIYARRTRFAGAPQERIKEARKTHQSRAGEQRRPEGSVVSRT